MPPQGRPLLLALISALAFGSSGVAAKPLIEAGLDPLHVAWLRIAGTALLLSPLAWRRRALLWERPALLLGFGMLGIAGVQAFYFAAMSRIPVGVALLIEYLGPLLVLGWVRFVRRAPVSRFAVVGVVLAVAGMACVVQIWSGLAFDALGLAFALCAAACQAGYFLCADEGTGDDQPDPLGVITFGFLAATLALTVVARPWTMDFSVLAGSVDLGGREIQAPLPYGHLVVVATLLAYVTGVLSVRLLSAQVAGVIAYLEVVVGIVLGWLLLHEGLTPAQLAGALLVLGGAFIAQRATPEREAQELHDGVPSVEPA
ncbi:EamA family transporter [Actinocorallia aurea]